ncbi:MAG: TlyA family RNA methyltransferase [Oscillospiraceae bacterium]|nr:TlyA family RNA methyltransferase [Oscillospiraceae bacterium]
MRLDVYLVKEGYLPTRAKAQQAIRAGKVKINNIVSKKTGINVTELDAVKVANTNNFVGRGGEKLQYALEYFALNVEELACLDVGASTGGFTQVLLQAGARRVFAVDVGHGQLDVSLRNNPRIVNLEGVNFRYFDPEILWESPKFACVDVSFISLKHILPKLAQCLVKPAKSVCLVKPQFEAGREFLNKQGVVKDPKIHQLAVKNVMEYAENAGFVVNGICESPIFGGAGNKEFLMLLNYSRLT